MEEQQVPTPRVRRHRKTRMEIIKEAYLPYIFLLTAALLIVVFIIGAVIRNANRKDAEPPVQDSTAPAIAALADTDRL